MPRPARRAARTALPALMRLPGRLHITWQDDRTLKIETDAGTQTRLLHFGGGAARRAGERTWQGTSTAAWDGVQGAEPARRAGDRCAW